MLTSFIPKQTLAQAWPNLTYDQKHSVSGQLDNILIKVRQIGRKGRPLGLINGQGVVDERDRHGDFRPDNALHTVAEFEDFLFSYKPWVSETSIGFLKKFLSRSRFDDECVFTHTDVRPANVMVDFAAQGSCTMIGIIDWEDARFHPSYWEAIKLTRTFLANDTTDWYLMQLRCIAPADYSSHWLVDRLRESMAEGFRIVDRNPQVRQAAVERQLRKELTWMENETASRRYGKMRHFTHLS